MSYYYRWKVAVGTGIVFADTSRAKLVLGDGKIPINPFTSSSFL